MRNKISMLLLVMGLLLTPVLTLHAAPAPADHTATNCEESGVGSIGQIATDVLSDTDATIRVILPNSGTCTWTSRVLFTWPATATDLIEVVGPGGGVLTIIDGWHNFTGDAVLAFAAIESDSFLFHGVKIQGGDVGGAEKVYGMVSFSGGTTGLEIYDNIFDGHSYTNASNVAHTLRYYGCLRGVVYDNTFNTNDFGTPNGTGCGGNAYGDTVWAEHAAAGSSDFIFYEENTLNPSRSNCAANDAYAGAKIVIRRNTINGPCGFQTHPTGGDSPIGGRARGARFGEFYQNTVNRLSAETSFNCNWMSSGGLLIWGNEVEDSACNFFITLHSMRRNNVTYASNAPPVTWGHSGPAPQSGVVNTKATAVTWVSGSQFNTSWSVVTGTMISIDGTMYRIAAVNSATSLTLATSAGTATNRTYTMGSNFDGNTDTLSGWPALDQPGRGMGDELSGDWPNVINVDNGNANYTSSNAWPRQAADPVREFMNTWSCTMCGAFVLNYEPDHLVENRDYFLEDETFDGTTGVGVGPIASRPATCIFNETTGVGPAYWATDEGEWDSTNGATPDGKMYTCTADDTWTPRYGDPGNANGEHGATAGLPYPFPHPLRETLVATSLNFTDQPASLVSSNQSLGNVQVSVLDQNDDILTSATNSITIALCMGGGVGTLNGTLTVMASSGAANFNDLSITSVSGGVFALCATSMGLIGDQSSNITVTAGGSAPNNGRGRGRGRGGPGGPGRLR